MAASLARKLPPWIDGEVLASEAEAAVWRAAHRFHPERGASFATWAGTVVHRSLLEEVRRQSPWTRLQRRLRRESLEAGMEPEAWMLPPLSLSATSSEENDGRHTEGAMLEEALPAPEDPATDPERSVDRVWLAQLLAGLEPRRREVVRRYFWGGESSREIAESLGVSVSRVQQLRQQAQEQLHLAITSGTPVASGGKRKRSRPKEATAALTAGAR
jgi:RNA polymerase sigma factor for flagellar operon FliA